MAWKRLVSYTGKVGYRVLFLGAFFGCCVVFWPILSSFFFQDDFLLLNRARITSITDLFQFFRPQADVIFYRPLSMSFFFWVTQFLFGHWYLGYKILTFILHIVNAALVFFLLRQVRLSDRFAALGSFLYLLHPLHFVALYWLSEVNLVIAQMFVFSSILTGVLFVRKQKKSFLVASFLLFLCGLLSNEFAVVTPILLGLMFIFLFHARLLPWLTMHGVLLISFLIFRFVLFPPVIAAGYEFHIDLSVVQTVWWYLLRTVGFPETGSVVQMVKEVNAPNIFFLGSFVMIGFLLTLSIRRPTSYRPLTFGLLWFLVALSPVIFLSEHKLASYAAFGLPGLLLAALTVVKEKFLFPIVILFAVFAFFSVRHQSSFHWVRHRAEIARFVLEDLQQKFPNGPPQSLFVDDTPSLSSEDVYLSLVGSEGVRFWFDRKDINVEYARWQDEPSQEAVVISFHR